MAKPTVSEKKAFIEAYWAERDAAKAFRAVYPQAQAAGSRDAWMVDRDAYRLLWDPMVRKALLERFQATATPLPEEMRLPRFPQLNDYERRFVDWYVETWDPVWAAKRAGYKDPEAAVHRLTQNPHIQAEIAQRVAGDPDLRNEITFRLRQHASIGAGSFIREGLDPATGEPRAEVDWGRVRDQGWAVKKIKPTRDGYEIEVHDSLKALELLARMAGNMQPENQTTVNVKLYDSRVSPDVWDDDSSD